MIIKNKITCIFKKIIDNYNLKVMDISENELALEGNVYILSFLYHSSELELVYMEKRNDGQIYQYNIDSFIAKSITDDDRKMIRENIGYTSGVEFELALVANTLQKRFTDLLLGGSAWIEQYKKFELYIPGRNITELKGKVYKNG